MVYAFSIALLVNAGSFSHNHGRYQGIGTCGIRYSGIWQVLMADAARLAESVVRYALYPPSTPAWLWDGGGDVQLHIYVEALGVACMGGMSARASERRRCR